MIPEREDVLEENLIKQLVSNQYQKVKIVDENQLNNNLKKQLEAFNKINLTSDEFNEVLSYLNQGTVFDKFQKLRKPYILSETNKTITFLNPKWEENIFQVTNQIQMKDKYQNRYDVTILINGLPIVQIELKHRGESLYLAFQQIERYKLHSYKNLFDYIQIFVISNGLFTRYFTNGILNNEINDFNYENTILWKDKNNNILPSIQNFTDSFLIQENLVNIITKYLIFDENKEKLIILRPYQINIINKILENVQIGENGYIQQAYGTGKSLTAYTLSKILLKKENLDKIIFLTSKSLNQFPNELTSKSKKNLIEKLTNNKRELIITKPRILFYATKEEVLKDYQNKKYCFIYDDANWTNYENNPKLIINFFKNSLFYGFTGAPYFNDNLNHGLTTRNIFNKRIDTYLLTDALIDKNILKVKIEYLDNETLTNHSYNSLKRLKQISDYIIKNHKSKTLNKKFNGLLILKTNKLIPYYYNILAKKGLKIATILHYNDNDELVNNKHFRDYFEDYIHDYNLNYNTNFNTKGYSTLNKIIDSYESDILKRFEENEIDLLITDESFLKESEYIKEHSNINHLDTGNLNTIYIDCDLNNEEILKLISKVGKIHNDKQEGNIITFHNMKNKVDKTLQYNITPNNPEDSTLKHYKYYTENFNTTLENVRGLCENPQAILNLKLEKEQKEYLKLFKNLEDLLNVLRGFNEFEFNDLNISEIEYVEYESGYKSLKTSTLNSKEEITNFNLKLIITDLINLDYLNDLLNNNPKNIFKIFKGEETIKLYSIYDEQLKKLNKDKIIDLEVFLENDNDKNLKICPSCDDIYPEDDNFCTEGCGELVKLTDYLSRKDLKTMICPVCNKLYNGDQSFCLNCGVKLKEIE